MHILIYGAGYVGITTGLCLADLGHNVVCIDNNSEKIKQINLGISPIHEKGIERLLKENLKKNLFKGAIKADQFLYNSDVSIIAVGTPFLNGRYDLSQIKKVSENIGKKLYKIKKYHVVCVKSTVPPGTTSSLVSAAIGNNTSLKKGVDYGLSMNPEFLAEGTAIKNFMNPDRIVIGGIDENSTALIKNYTLNLIVFDL